MYTSRLRVEALPPEMMSETVRLPDGRRLGLVQAGDLHGAPIFFFHGFGSSRLGIHPDEGIARLLGARLIALDRPGAGLSDPQPGRSLLDWPADVAAAADRLGLERFALLGWSTGGPHALAGAACLPARVSAVGLVSSAVPLAGRPPGLDLPRGWQRIASLARFAPWALRFYISQTSRRMQRDPQDILAQTMAEQAPADREIASQPLFYKMLWTSALEGFANGGRGVLEDALALCRPWGFELAGVRARVLLWHGEQDQVWPAAAGRWLAGSIPGCQAVFYPDEGHLLYLSHWAEILQALVAAQRQE